MYIQRALLSCLLLLPVTACGGGGGGGGGIAPSGPIDPPPGLGTDAPGLTSAVALLADARVDFLLPATGFDAALFVAASPGAVFAGAPVLEGLTGSSGALTGLPTHTNVYVGLGLRPQVPDGGAYVPVGSVLRLHTGDPIYVDWSADPFIADGQTPGTAFADITTAALTAFADGGGRLFVREGTYAVTSIPILDDVDVYGGFDATFDLATRGQQTTQLVGGQSGVGMLVLAGGPTSSVIDGVHLDGESVGSFGIDVSDVGAEIRGCVIEHCAGRGIRLRNAIAQPTEDVLIVGTSSSLNEADGLSSSGAFRVTIEGSRFDANVQEGVDLDDLVALDGDVASLTVRGCGFFGNGAQGLDVDLAGPLGGGPGGGLFQVTIDDSDFELNGDEGLLIDQDHEALAGWRAEIQVRGVHTRGNRLAGIRIDADSDSSIIVHRVASVGNGSDGLWVSSETAPGLALVTSSAFVANRGAGLRASLGNRALAASHCVFAGNTGGGMVSTTVTSTAASCVAYLQSAPWTGTETAGELELVSPFPAPWANAPESIGFALSYTMAELTLEADLGAVAGMVAELANDAVARDVIAAGGTLLEVDPAPELFLTPGAVLIYGAGATVEEDWAPSPGSVLIGAGMTPAGGPAVDAGPFGATVGGQPGEFDSVEPALFRLAGTTPPVTSGLGASETLRLNFEGGTLDAASVVADSVRVFGAAGVVPALVSFDAGDVLITPPGGGWGTGPLLIEVHGLLAAADGRPLAAGTALHFTTP